MDYNNNQLKDDIKTNDNLVKVDLEYLVIYTIMRILI